MFAIEPPEPLAAGVGFKPGDVHGETDDFCDGIAKDPASVHDYQATMLHRLGFDHYRFQVRDFRLTDVESQLAKPLIA